MLQRIFLKLDILIQQATLPLSIRRNRQEFLQVLLNISPILRFKELIDPGPNKPGAPQTNNEPFGIIHIRADMLDQSSRNDFPIPQSIFQFQHILTLNIFAHNQLVLPIPIQSPLQGESIGSNH